MCKVLQIPRSTYYYEAKIKPSGDELSSKVVEIFQANRQSYGTRKIKVELKSKDSLYLEDELVEL